MIIQHTGWTWDYIEDNMTVYRISKLVAYWRENPPVQTMIAAYLGIKKEPARNKEDLVNIIGGLPTTKIVKL